MALTRELPHQKIRGVVYLTYHESNRKHPIKARISAFCVEIKFVGDNVSLFMTSSLSLTARILVG